MQEYISTERGQFLGSFFTQFCKVNFVFGLPFISNILFNSWSCHKIFLFYWVCLESKPCSASNFGTYVFPYRNAVVYPKHLRTLLVRLESYFRACRVGNSCGNSERIIRYIRPGRRRARSGSYLSR